VHDLAQDFHETIATSRAELERLIEKTKSAREELAVRLEQGRDRLLEMNSFRPAIAATLVEEIGASDGDVALDEFMLAVFDHYAIHVEELRPRTYQLGSAGVFADSFPGLPSDGLTVTCDRARALAREDVSFLTWDHPLVTGALDLLLGSEKGNCSFGRWPDERSTGLYLEAVYLLECVAPPALHLDRFLPPTPVRVLLDHRGTDVSAAIARDLLARNLQAGDAYALLDQPEFREGILPALIEKSLQAAERIAPGIIAQARGEMASQLGHEFQRLVDLQKVNRSVRSEEIELLAQQRRSLEEQLVHARLRLDAIRIIQRGPA
jgi:ATP-dependent helicase HepA